MRQRRPFSVLAWAALACVPLGAAPAAAEVPCTMRVESQLFADGESEPMARSLTVFRDGVAWDFLELSPAPAEADTAAPTVREIVLHDPARERVVVIDPARHVKTEIGFIRLERLSVSLANWARTTDDKLVRWAGGPDFGGCFSETEDRLELIGPRVRYAVAHVPAPSSEAAAAYRRFADTALLLKALLHPGGIPPFPRLAVNRRLEAAGALPAEVTLEIDTRPTPLAGRPERLRCVHRIHPRLLGGDIDRVQDAEAHMAASEAVDLATFAEQQAAEATLRQERPGS